MTVLTVLRTIFYLALIVGSLLGITLRQGGAISLLQYYGFLVSYTVATGMGTLIALSTTHTTERILMFFMVMVTISFLSIVFNGEYLLDHHWDNDFFVPEKDTDA